MERIPRVGVGAVILRGNEVLLVKRGQEPGKGLWSVPGGRLEWNETLKAGVEREALEETGLVVEAERLAGVSELIAPGKDGEESFHYVLIDYICRVISGEARSADDAADLRWWPIDRVQELASTADLAEKLRKWTAG